MQGRKGRNPGGETVQNEIQNFLQHKAAPFSAARVGLCWHAPHYIATGGDRFMALLRKRRRLPLGSVADVEGFSGEQKTSG